MSDKFTKISNITQIAIWSVFGILMLLATITMGAYDKMDFDFFVLSNEFLTNIIAYPFLAGFGAELESFVIAIIIGIVVTLAIAWLLFVAIRAVMGKENPAYFNIISLVAAAIGLIVVVLNLIFLSGLQTLEIPFLTILAAIILILAFAYVIVIEVLKLIKKN